MSRQKYFRADVPGEDFPRLFAGGVYGCDAQTAERVYEISETEYLRENKQKQDANGVGAKP